MLFVASCRSTSSKKAKSPSAFAIEDGHADGFFHLISLPTPFLLLFIPEPQFYASLRIS